MEAIATGLSTLGMGAVYLAAFVFVLGIVVFIHELGHFSVARFFNTRVETFSIGFGGEIFGWTDRKGTRWKVSWIPLGGYVKFWGDENAASVPDAAHLARMKAAGASASDCFHLKPVGQRAAIVAAGPAANFLLALVVLTGLIAIFGETRLPPRIGGVMDNTPAAAAGFQAGDLIREVNGRAISDYADLKQYVVLRDGVPMTFLVERGNQTVVLTAAPELTEIGDPIGGTCLRGGQLGVRFESGQDAFEHLSYGPGEAALRAAERTWTIVVDSLTYIGRLITGAGDPSQMTGPIGMANVSGKVAQIGFVELLGLVAIVSISIGLINLFPIPMLDGGHLLFYAFEAVRGEPLGERIQEMGFRAGLALVLCLMLFATWNDLTKLGAC